MKSNYKSRYQLVAKLLLVVFLLENCYNNISPQPEKETITHASDVVVECRLVPNEQILDKQQQIIGSNDITAPLAKTSLDIEIEHGLVIRQKSMSLVSYKLDNLTLAKKASVNQLNNQTQVNNTSYPAICISNQGQIIEKQKKLAKKSERRKDNPQLVSLLLNQQVCLVKEGHQISFEKKQESDELQAVVQECLPTGFSRKNPLPAVPVIIEPGFRASERAVKNPAWQKAYIHDLKEYVYVGTMGLKGGGPGTEKNKIKSIFSATKSHGILASRQLNSTSHMPIMGGSTNNKVISSRKFNSVFEKNPDFSSHPLIKYVNPSPHYFQSLLPYVVPGIQVRKLSKYQERNEETLEWYKMRAEQGVAEAQFKLGLMYESGQGITQNLTNAVELFRDAANKNHPEAQYRLGLMYESGRGLPIHLPKAVEWFQNAAKNSHPEAQYKLGLMYESGRGVPTHLPSAVEWFRKAAIQDHPEAQYKLGLMYESGQGLSLHLPNAVEWFRKAAKNSYPAAQYKLGLMYESGRGIDKDMTKAVEWFQNAANQGDANAQYKLGLMYKSGQGLPLHLPNAVEWFRKAALQDHPEAQYNLGLMYESGQGVDKDMTKAVEWFQKAANQGDANAQSKLKLMYGKQARCN